MQSDHQERAQVPRLNGLVCARFPIWSLERYCRHGEWIAVEAFDQLVGFGVGLEALVFRVALEPGTEEFW